MQRYIILQMIGLLRPFVLLLLPLAAVADGRTPGQDPEEIAAASELESTLLALGKTDTRLTVAVAVGSRGPYHFVIDTGAERTVVSRELAGSLGLVAGQSVRLTSMTGTSDVETVIVPDLSIQSIGQLHTVTAPALFARNLGAAGLLGVDTLRNHQVTIDIEHATMEVRPSQPRKRFAMRNRDEIVVTAKSVFGQLIVTDAYYNNTRIQVVLDTGSQVTMGNSALRKRMGRNVTGFRPLELTSVTGGETIADYTLVSGVRIGAVLFDTLPVAFSDVAPFKRFGLTKRPALLLGMDALRSFRKVDIDFPNREVRFLMPAGARRPVGPTPAYVPQHGPAFSEGRGN